MTDEDEDFLSADPRSHCDYLYPLGLPERVLKEWDDVTDHDVLTPPELKFDYACVNGGDIKGFEPKLRAFLERHHADADECDYLCEQFRRLWCVNGRYMISVTATYSFAKGWHLKVARMPRPDQNMVVSKVPAQVVADLLKDHRRPPHSGPDA